MILFKHPFHFCWLPTLRRDASVVAQTSKRSGYCRCNGAKIQVEKDQNKTSTMSLCQKLPAPVCPARRWRHCLGKPFPVEAEGWVGGHDAFRGRRSVSWSCCSLWWSSMTALCGYIMLCRNASQLYVLKSQQKNNKNRQLKYYNDILNSPSSVCLTVVLLFHFILLFSAHFAYLCW